MEKLHLDTDLGGDTDDLCALAMLLKWPELQITSITTNTELDGKRAGYTKYALKVAGREEIPVKAGADISGGYYRGSPGLPNESDYWPESITRSHNDVDEALELLKASIEQNAIIVGIGAFTNFYLLDQKYPGILRGARLYLMGGYVYPVREGYPQWGNDMDWNVQVDVNSAKYVLENSNPILVPLSVTVETAVKKTHLPALRKSGKLGEILVTQLEAQSRTFKNEENFGLLNFLHDPLACAIALGWNEGVEIKEVPLKFEMRDSYLHEMVDNTGRPTKVVTKVDGNKFNDFWLNVVTFISR